MVGMTASTIQRTATVLNKWLDDYSKAYKKSATDAAKKRRSDCYTLADLMQDTVELWRVGLCETWNVSDYDVRMTPMATGAPERTAARAARRSR